MGAPRLALPINEVVRLYQSGYGCKYLAERFGCGRDTILRRLRENGIEPDGRPGYRHLKPMGGRVRVSAPTRPLASVEIERLRELAKG